ncbi:BON domain-containing protein [Nocardia donostiensis]|uniref:BON domain-containing protein n=1 Tax=Nocardia donostiensis TaxID=1538463 RepID=UPI0009D9E9EA|nr:BON domain-containing protein [Nocardia donostiensis]OQS13019.1 phospholipid-binding protein [Nocardia donostiensis]
MAGISNEPGAARIQPPEYLAAKLHRALAEDPRTSEQGVQVRIRGEVVVLDGEVGNAERRRMLEDVVRELLPDARIHNDVHITGSSGPGECEDLS